MKKPTAGQRIIESAKQALAFAECHDDHGCVVHISEEIDGEVSRMIQSEQTHA